MYPKNAPELSGSAAIVDEGETSSMGCIGLLTLSDEESEYHLINL
jgi:hypothetical protein